MCVMAWSQQLTSGLLVIRPESAAFSCLIEGGRGHLDRPALLRHILLRNESRFIGLDSVLFPNVRLPAGGFTNG